ncbi:conserved phage protein [Burkholderia phage BcepF1]|uniref:Conserved phage protein n=1 Tax=Burkholderia phage BcepF1 TaxID=2886897 RepID=A1YZZ9_9CAUD|nr:tail fiber assembly protein [Burkholderia phage BcepF1]ABL96826.1 conserved phage protein [Burkholderia phage BcepF1]
MISQERVWFTLKQAFPELQSGKDFHICARTDDNGNQVGDPEIQGWKSKKHFEPTMAQIKRLAEVYDSEWKLACANNSAGIRIKEELQFAGPQIEYATDVQNKVAESEWRGYRVLIREVRNQIGFPMEIDWPVRPKVIYEHSD